jgi:hypothetical protein
LLLFVFYGPDLCDSWDGNLAGKRESGGKKKIFLKEWRLKMALKIGDGTSRLAKDMMKM